MLRQIVCEEGDGLLGVFLSQLLCELYELRILACMIEGVEMGDANVIVDGSSGLMRGGEGILLFDERVVMHL